LIFQCRKLTALKWLYSQAKAALDNYGIHLLIQMSFFIVKTFCLEQGKILLLAHKKGVLVVYQIKLLSFFSEIQRKHALEM